MPSQTRKLAFVALAFVLALLLSAYTLAPNRASAQSAQAALPATSSTVHFTQIAFASSLSGDSTYIDNINTNNKPNALLFVTPNVSPGGVPRASDPHPVGVWYNTSLKEWAIFNQDKATMTNGADFNVMVGAEAGGGGTEFLQTTTASNRSGNATSINNTATNGLPNGVLFVTPNWNPGGIGGTYEPHPVGVQYNTGSGQWMIVNEDGATMPLQAAFNVLAFPS